MMGSRYQLPPPPPTLRAVEYQRNLLLQEPSTEERIKELEREVAELKRRMRQPLDCTGPSGEVGKVTIRPAGG